MGWLLIFQNQRETGRIQGVSILNPLLTPRDNPMRHLCILFFGLSTLFSLIAPR